MRRQDRQTKRPADADERGDTKDGDGEEKEESQDEEQRDITIKNFWDVPKPTCCSICPTKPTKDGKNWHKSADDGKGHLEPVGPLCGRCGGFFDESGLPPEKIIKMKTQSKKTKAQLAQHVEDYNHNKDSPDDREF